MLPSPLPFAGAAATAIAGAGAAAAAGDFLGCCVPVLSLLSVCAGPTRVFKLQSKLWTEWTAYRAQIKFLMCPTMVQADEVRKSKKDYGSDVGETCLGVGRYQIFVQAMLTYALLLRFGSGGYVV